MIVDCNVNSVTKFLPGASFCKLAKLILVGLFVFSGTLASAQDSMLRLATTTSTENSGLLAVLLPAFEKHADVEVQTLAVGTGKALKLGENGDVDVVMVHAREAEEQFVAAGYGSRREEFMYNDFVVVGPSTDPANIGGTDNVQEALSLIMQSQSVFVSRGDDSGTHKRELMLWQETGSAPTGSWYREAGQGMGKVLQIASELQGYTLTDRGTWLKLNKSLELELLLEADPRLFNFYGVIPVNPERHDHVNNKAAEVLVDWLISLEGQKIIGAYLLEGQQAFVPTRWKP